MSVTVTLPDGSQRQFDAPVTVRDVAASIGAGLAKAALGARVDGKLVDTSYTIAHDAALAIVTDKSDDALEIIRHSTAHLLAQAVKALFPSAQVTIGPVIEDGFYYDFAFERPFTPEDLAAIEKKMEELAAADIPVERSVMPRDEAVAFFRGMGEEYKAEIIASIPQGEDLSLYRQGDFIDLCRGPHVPSTGKLKAFKLTKLAGAYWRGDSRNEMLQRIYGTSWADPKALKAYLHRIEEAERRDHRRIGKKLRLFHTQEEAPGMVFWHPRGWAVYQAIEQYMRAKLQRRGYQEIRTPQVVDFSLWQRSGHADKFAENMFALKSEERDFAVKPMNCPCHVQVFNQGLKSYRDLPLRLAEFGSCHRNEPSGSLHGLMRVRGFTQDDAHIFCTEEQIQARSGAVHRPAARGLCRFRLQRRDLPPLDAPGEPRRQRRDLGQGRAGAGGRAERPGPGVGAAAGRGRLLRPEDRVLAARLHRSRLAVRHDPGRFLDARTPGRAVRGRGRQPPDAGDAAPRRARFLRAFHRHPDRAPRRGFPRVARAGAGRGDEYYRRPA